MIDNIISLEQVAVKPEPAPILCLCCDSPATHVLGDWDVCEAHHAQLSGPWPGVDDLGAWWTVRKADFTMSVDRQTNEVSYEDAH